MKESRYLQLLAIVLLCASSFLSGQSKIQSLIQELEQSMDNKSIPGAMLCIVTSDSVLFAGGLGYADLYKKEKVTSDHLFRLGSISKSFTALGLLKSLDNSPFGLDSPIRHIDNEIPFTNEWEDQSPVRVAHLLEHTTGFEDFHLHAICNNKDTNLPPIRQMVEDHKNSLFARWQPGTRKAYSNPNYILAGHLIEVISGSPFNKFIEKNITLPLGMKSSGFYFKEPKDLAFAKGYKRDGKELNVIPFTTINGSPAGDFCSNAGEMASYLMHMLSKDTTLFEVDYFDRIENPKTSLAAKNGLQHGYGLGNYAICKKGFTFHGHGGEIEGYASRYLYSPEANIGVALAINRNADANALVDEILENFFDDQGKVAVERTILPIPDELRNRYAGFYEFKSPKSNLLAFTDRMLAGLILDFEEDKVLAKTILGKPRYTLYYTGDRKFFINDESAPTTILLDSPSGKPAFWINDNYTERESRNKRLVLFFGLLISVLLLFTFSVFGVFWLLRNRLRSDRQSSSNHLVILGFACSLILMFVGFGLTMSDVKSATDIKFSSILFYCSSYSAVLFMSISLYRCFKLPNKTGFRIYYILTSIAALVITLYLWNIGFIGLRLWSY